MSTSESVEPVRRRAYAGEARALLSLAEAAEEAGVSYRFLQLEISRRRLVAVRLSNRIVRIRRVDWERYLANNLTAVG